MKVMRSTQRWREDVKQPQGRFQGRARQRVLHETPLSARVSFVSFEPGAHTHWHSHSGGQVLQVVDGSLRVQSWGEAIQTLEVGDASTTPPDEKHWHGAGPGGPMTHLAVTCGDVQWFEDAEPT